MGILFFFIFFVIKKFFLRNISVNINFDVSLVLTENSLWIKKNHFLIALAFITLNAAYDELVRFVIKLILNLLVQ